MGRKRQDEHWTWDVREATQQRIVWLPENAGSLTGFCPFWLLSWFLDSALSIRAFFLGSGRNPWLTCLEDGLWSLPEAYCKLECDAPPVIPNAGLLVPHCLQGNHDVGSVCRYECKPGYYAVPSAENKVRRWAGLFLDFCTSLYPYTLISKSQTVTLEIILRPSGLSTTCCLGLFFYIISLHLHGYIP